MKKRTKYFHIDNGGITISLEDKGPQKGIWFEIVTEYFGYPGLRASMRLDGSDSNLALRFFGGLREFCDDVIRDLQEINWSQRYEYENHNLR